MALTRGAMWKWSWPPTESTAWIRHSLGQVGLIGRSSFLFRMTKLVAGSSESTPTGWLCPTTSKSTSTSAQRRICRVPTSKRFVPRLDSWHWGKNKFWAEKKLLFFLILEINNWELLICQGKTRTSTFITYTENCSVIWTLPKL